MRYEPRFTGRIEGVHLIDGRVTLLETRMLDATDTSDVLLETTRAFTFVANAPIASPCDVSVLFAHVSMAAPDARSLQLVNWVTVVEYPTLDSEPLRAQRVCSVSTRTRKHARGTRVNTYPNPQVRSDIAIIAPPQHLFEQLRYHAYGAV